MTRFHHLLAFFLLLSTAAFTLAAPAKEKKHSSEHHDKHPSKKHAAPEKKSGGGKHNSKRGLALIEGHPDDIKHAANSAISWTYGWNVPKPNPLPSGIQHVPMIWGNKNGPEQFAGQVKKMGSKVILGFNEPDMPSQASMSPAQAVQLWKKDVLPLKKAGVRLGSPAVSSAPQGKQWLSEFMKQCSGCSVDFIALHWYGEGASNFKNYLQEMHKAFPKQKIWVTEFADTSADAKAVSQFMKDSLHFLDSTSYIERYAWFAYGRSTPNMHTNLLDGSGNLTPLGKQYVA